MLKQIYGNMIKELAKLTTGFCMLLQAFYCIGAVKCGTIFQSEVELAVLS